MSDINFACPSCSQRIACDDSHSGDEVACPACGNSVIVPERGGLQGSQCIGTAPGPVGSQGAGRTCQGLVGASPRPAPAIIGQLIGKHAYDGMPPEVVSAFRLSFNGGVVLLLIGIALAIGFALQGKTLTKGEGAIYWVFGGMAAYGIFCIVVGAGVKLRRNWARRIMVILAAEALNFSLARYLKGPEAKRWFDSK